MNEQSLSRGLAWFSFGLGFAELFAPRHVARLIGVDESHARLIQLCGVREIGAGFGIMQYKPSAFLWSRVAGDVMDLGLLAAALRSENSDPKRVKTAIAAVAAVTALDVAVSVMRSRDGVDPSWRVQRDDLAGIEAADPAAHRAYVDEAWARQQNNSNRPESATAELAAATATSV